MLKQLNDNILEFTPENNLTASHLNEQMYFIKKELGNTDDYESVSINLKNVDEIDSLGINLIVGVYKHVDSEKKKLFLNKTSNEIKKLLKLFKLDTYFEIL